jgi:hypothetical protein
MPGDEGGCVSCVTQERLGRDGRCALGSTAGLVRFIRISSVERNTRECCLWNSCTTYISAMDVQHCWRALLLEAYLNGCVEPLNAFSCLVLEDSDCEVAA